MKMLAALAAATLLAAAPALAQTPAPASPAPPGSTVYFLFVYSAGPSWKAGQPLSAQGLAPHGAYMRKLFSEGVLVAGGPSTDPQGAGLAIIKAKDAAEAKALLAADPAVQTGIMSAQLRDWRPVFAAKTPLLP